jgi:hypothetical protein
MGKTVSSTNTFNVYPNPGNGILTINYSSNYTSTLQLRIVNILGETIYQNVQENIHGGMYTKNVDLSAQPKGIYFITLMNGNKSEIKKTILN